MRFRQNKALQLTGAPLRSTRATELMGRRGRSCPLLSMAKLVPIAND